jgi:two-component system, OmpR family, clock-associated histidine kinase SasA
MLPSSKQNSDCGPKPLLELLFFVERQITAQEQIQQVRDYLDALQTDYSVKLHVVEVSEQPYLVEYYRLVVTPALVKIYPEPSQVLAGTSLLEQLQECWPHWEQELEVQPDQGKLSSLACSTQVMKLSDEVFRLQQDNEALQEQLRFKERVAAMMAHDLRNPLTAAAIAIETLEGQWGLEQAQPLPTETMIKLIDHARTQIKVIDRMIASILDASQEDSTTLKIQPKKLNLVSLCHQTLETFADRLADKSQTLETDLPLDLPQVHGDADQIRQVLINLLENSTKYTPRGGSIKLSALHRTTQKIQVSIEDDGPGIPLEKQQYIFDDRFRLSRDQAQEGYGMGLTLCQRIVKAHFGQIWVDSPPDKGSSFHFTLPVYHQ